MTDRVQMQLSPTLVLTLLHRRPPQLLKIRIRRWHTKTEQAIRHVDQVTQLLFDLLRRHVLLQVALVLLHVVAELVQQQRQRELGLLLHQPREEIQIVDALSLLFLVKVFFFVVGVLFLELGWLDGQTKGQAAIEVGDD